MIKAIIFDCFGVVYPDTLALVERRFLRTADEPKKQAIREIRLKSDRGIISRGDFWQGVADILEIPLKSLETELDKVRGADWELLEYIKTLKQKFGTALLSNVGTGFLERIFDAQRPAENYFDVIVASADIGAIKPDPKAYMAVVERLEAAEPSECIFVDDKLIHCQGAEAIGMQAIIYQDFQQLKHDLDKILSQA